MRHRRKKIVYLLVVVCFLIGLSHSVMAKDYLYVPSNNHLHVIDCDSDTIIKTITFNDYIVNGIASPDGKRYYMNAWHSIYAVDTESNEIVDTYKFSSDLNRVSVMPGIAVSPDNKYLYLSVSITKKKLNIPRLNVLPPQLVVYDIKKKQIAKNFEIPYACSALVSPPNDRNHVILLAQDIFKINIKNGKLTKMLGILHPEEGEPGLNAFAIWNSWSPGKNGVVTLPAYSADELYYLLFDKKGNVNKLKAEEVVMAYSGIVSPDLKYLYATMDEVYKIDYKTGKTLAMDILERGTCYTVNLTSDGKKLYVGPGGPDISVYDTATMKRIGIIPLKGDGVSSSMISK
ncbi:MAG: hypothetical protein JRH15_20725 [Deltaproteobacteria bacterium]|nr:hypothetical protein [Deltaproteobacteria bacterium]